MAIKKVYLFILVVILALVIFFFNQKFFFKEEVKKIEFQDDNSYSSNIIKEVNYVSKDARGNEYIIDAETGEIDINNPDIIYLTNVEAIIKMKNSEKININSKFGKYNTKNFDTIFSKNVIIKYLTNIITGEYLDFSLENNMLMISKNIVYRSPENILFADVLEMNIKTKDTKIFMYEEQKNVKIQSVE